MIEKQTEYHGQSDASKTDNFEEVLGWQAKDAAKRIVEELIVEEEPIVKPTELENTLRNKLIATGVGVTAVISGLAGLNALDNSPERAPTFSEETTTVAAVNGDSIFSIVNKVPGSDTVDIRDAVDFVSTRPVNSDVLKDGLQIGEQIEVPISINGVKSTDEQ